MRDETPTVSFPEGQNQTQKYHFVFVKKRNIDKISHHAIRDLISGVIKRIIKIVPIFFL